MNRQTIFEEGHMHSTYSDGKNSIGALLAYNALHDQLDMTFTDHVNQETDWFEAYVQEIKKYREQYPQFAIRIGCEVKILEDGTLNTTPEIIAASDIVIGSVHHFTNIKTMTKEELLEKEFELSKLIAVHPEVDILGHPFSMAERFFNVNPPPEYVQELYDLCVANNVKFEFNQKHARSSLRDLISQEMQNGNLHQLSFGTDLHKDVAELGDAAFDLVPPINVLVTGAGAGVGQSILKSLKLSKVPTRIIGVDMSPLAAGLYRCDASYIVPSAKDANYIGALEDICAKENIELVLVGTDVELSALADAKVNFEKKTGAHVLVSPLETISMADDKWKTVEFLKEKEFPYVRSALKTEVDVFLKEEEFPVIVKPRIGAGAIGFEVVPNKERLLELLEQNPDLIIQEHLSDDDAEFTCGAFFWEGECYGVVPMQRWLRHGDTYKAVARHNPELEVFVADVGKTMKINGPCNFQLRKHNGEYKIFEVNCRFSGTTGIQSALGFNPLNMWLQHMFINRPLRQVTFKEGVALRYWNEIITPIEDLETMQHGHHESPTSSLNVI